MFFLFCRANLPEGWRWLMSEPQSPIIDFYPDKFEIDLAGKKFASQGVVLLPFVDEKRLLDAIGNVCALFAIKILYSNFCYNFSTNILLILEL
jgi:5'-3' exonuclease